MKTKEQAFQLYQNGLSYNQIGKKLSIGKTTAYDYVKEIKLSKIIINSSAVPNGSELGLNGRSERIPNESSEQKKQEKSIQEINLSNTTNTVLKLNEFTGDDLIKKKFDTLNFEGKFLELIGKPSKIFSAVIWGLPKGGKSNLAIRFADYLQEYFGKVLYIAAEEGESATLQQKFKEIDGSRVTILETRNKEEIRNYLKEKDFGFVFIDSINNAGIDSEFLQLLKTENQNKSFIAVAQATKGGNFKGDQSLTHNCDFVIKVVDGIAYQEGRFSPASEIKIFDEPLYQKNKNKIPEIKKSDYIFGEIVTKKKVVLKPFDEAFPNTIKTTKNITNEVLTPTDIKLSSKETTTNLNRINYTMELLKIMDTYEVQYL